MGGRADSVRGDPAETRLRVSLATQPGAQLAEEEAGHREAARDGMAQQDHGRGVRGGGELLPRTQRAPRQSDLLLQ